MMRKAALVLSLSASIASCAPTNVTGPTARVRNGTYQGVYSPEYNQDYFLGIPYAQPPVGSLRFRNPVSLNQSWTDTRPAAQYSTACYGYGSDQWGYPVSEDCLYVNVVRPAGCEDEKLPVAFWIHGGGYYMGTAVDQRYNLTFMVQNSVNIGKPVIGVSINYRLSAWGFLSGSAEIQKSGEMNLGLRDQRLALQWVQDNVEAFGGDPEKVTILGESAGAGSVGFQLTAYSGRDDKLFRGAIMQSGNPVHFNHLNDPLEYSEWYNAIVSRTPCVNATSQIECLRTLSAEQYNAAVNVTSLALNTTGFMPVLDGDFIQKRTSIQMANGEFVHVPIISGANSDEGSAFSPSPVDTTEDLYAFLTSGEHPIPPELANQLLEAYPDDLSVNVIANLGDTRPGPPRGAQFRRSASYYGDQFFIALRRLTCQTWATAGVPAYCYRFNAIPAGLPPVIGVTHFQEVAFVFLNLLGVGYPPIAVPPFENKTQSYSDLSKFMSSSWVSFVSDLDPNSWRDGGVWNGTEELWPAYDNADPQDYVFDANVTSHAEADTWRKEGMELINANNLEVYGR
ncbi:carboxylesterase family protein-like protein [Boeremia exigua]|uniref:carboxylesterase family protein-like protein n=1 Tax=Boeremia exigua TaxID=749465 RepID=UPI001E8E85BA|nr:carboxylesterase family protein-like protein [Boeremia exigua]KAH6616573.1 carboxylesterase family protein-like protein [Boeremia exigua]